MVGLEELEVTGLGELEVAARESDQPKKHHPIWCFGRDFMLGIRGLRHFVSLRGGVWFRRFFVLESRQSDR